jgi:hypothetical protein
MEGDEYIKYSGSPKLGWREVEGEGYMWRWLWWLLRWRWLGKGSKVK